MPKDCALMLKIFPDGRVGVPVHLNWRGTLVVKGAEAIPVPPHGRLGDLDALKKVFEECHEDSWWFEGKVDDAPTIIPPDDK